jgi:hypothetical protein
MFPELTGKKVIFPLQKFFFLSSKVFFCGVYEGDPLSPPQGEATCGEHPPDPHLSRYFHQPV